MSMINHQTLQDADTSEEHRRSDRQVVTVRWVAKMTGEKGQELCLIRNISTGGVMANIYSTHEVGEQISLEIRSGQQLQGEIVWMRDGWDGLNRLTSGTPVLPDGAVDLFGFSGGQASFDARVDVAPLA